MEGDEGQVVSRRPGESWEILNVPYSAQVNYLDGLNDAQKKAVLATRGPVSVLAGAGAGKTRVLATRIYHLIREGVTPESILAVTFTNKAAREMRQRIRLMLNLPDSGFRTPGSEVPFIATFHGLGRELLERYGRTIGVPRYFSVYDRDDSERLIGQALKALDVEAKELSPRAVLSRISRAKNEGLSLTTFREHHGRASFGNRVAAEAWGRYEEALRAEKALDFDDLIGLPVRLLETDQAAREAIQERWRYLHIDEYQDTNDLQERMAAILAERHKNIFVVGDGDQAIYGWRGANMEHILRFDERYPGAETIILERNYRSSATIVDAANAVIEKNVKRKEKRSTTDNAIGEPIHVHTAVSAEDEARWIARKCKELMRGETLNAARSATSGEPPPAVLAEDIAVLFRTNFQSRALEESFLREGVPYKLLGTRFFERKEVKDALAWMRLALDPSREADKVRAAGAPPRGIGKVTLAKLAAGQRGQLRPGETAKVEAFEAVVAELVQAVESLAPSEFVKLVIEKSGMRRALFEEGGEAERERFENVVELAAVAARHDAFPGKEGIAAFLAEAVLSGEQDEMDRPQSDASRRGVALMTVHAAKGLEFDTVFVAGMEEGLFPHASMGANENRDEEEERRLFYVAITRAKWRLYLTFARVRSLYGETYLTEPSSFLADIDPALTAYDDGNEESVIEA
ncbi:MAG: UvrD-helicase domain-containing protein [bacterium]|nr:UvrD-helicase domain-containing protein [bacterium]